MSKETEVGYIKRPIFIMHETDSGKVECMIAGREDWDHRQYGLYIADLIGHTVKALGCTREELLEWVFKELDHPTTKLKRTNVQ